MTGLELSRNVTLYIWLRTGAWGKRVFAGWVHRRVELNWHHCSTVIMQGSLRSFWFRLRCRPIRASANQTKEAYIYFGYECDDDDGRFSCSSALFRTIFNPASLFAAFWLPLMQISKHANGLFAVSQCEWLCVFSSSSDGFFLNVQPYYWQVMWILE